MWIHTKRLLIRAIEEEDVANLRQIWGSSDVMQFCGGPLEGEHRLCRSVQYYKTLEAMSGISAYAVIEKESDEMIGVCGFNPTEEKGTMELIYHFKTSTWGRGYATEASMALIDYLRSHFSHDVVKKLVASVAPENRSSGRVLEKCGFKNVGDKWFEDTQRFEPSYELIL